MLLAQLEQEAAEGIAVALALPSTVDAARVLHDKVEDLVGNAGGVDRRRRLSRGSAHRTLEGGQQLEQCVAQLVGAAARGAGPVENLADRRVRQAQAAQKADGGQGESGG